MTELKRILLAPLAMLYFALTGRRELLERLRRP
jgi:hypothetical protein